MSSSERTANHDALTRSGLGPCGSLHICHFASAATSIYHLLKDQILALQARGHRVRALSGPMNGDCWEATSSSWGIVHDTGPIVRQIAPWQDVRTLAWLIRYFRRHRFDIVHTHTPKAGLIGPAAARLAGVPLVVHTVHGFLFNDQSSSIRRFEAWLAEKWTASWVDVLLFQSREDLEATRRLHLLDQARCFYIGNGVNVARFQRGLAAEERSQRRAALGFRPNDFVVGFVGRLTLKKGIIDLLNAFEQISHIHREARLLVVGLFDRRKDSLDRRDLDAWEKKTAVLFAGYDSRMEDLYPLMDLFVLPSYWEGVPRVLVEACIAGVPAIATNIRGNREIIKNGVTGLLYTPGRVNELAKCIKHVMADRVAAANRARAAQSSAVTNFDESLVFDRVALAYDSFWPLARGRRQMKTQWESEVLKRAGEPSDF